MTNVEKALEIARKCVYCFADAQNGALKMAKWKDQQFKEFLDKIGRGEKWAAFERFMNEKQTDMTNKAKEYSEQRILAIPADVNEEGQVFYLNEDLGTADDNGLAEEIEMAFNNGYGVALLKVKEIIEKKRKKYTTGLSVALQKNATQDAVRCDKVQCVLCEIINEIFKEE